MFRRGTSAPLLTAWCTPSPPVESQLSCNVRLGNGHGHGRASRPASNLGNSPRLVARPLPAQLSSLCILLEQERPSRSPRTCSGPSRGALVAPDSSTRSRKASASWAMRSRASYTPRRAAAAAAAAAGERGVAAARTTSWSSTRSGRGCHRQPRPRARSTRTRGRAARGGTRGIGSASCVGCPKTAVPGARRGNSVPSPSGTRQRQWKRRHRQRQWQTARLGRERVAAAVLSCLGFTRCLSLGGIIKRLAEVRVMFFLFFYTRAEGTDTKVQERLLVRGR